MREDHEHQADKKTGHAIRTDADQRCLAPALTLSLFVGVATVGATLPLRGGGMACRASQPR